MKHFVPFSTLRVKDKLIRIVLFGAFLVMGFMAGCGPLPAFAQADAKPVLKARLTATELEAINSLGEKLTANLQQRTALVERLAAVEQEMRTGHPGYHFDEPTGELLPDPKPEPAKPEPAKK